MPLPHPKAEEGGMEQICSIMNDQAIQRILSESSETFYLIGPRRTPTGTLPRMCIYAGCHLGNHPLQLSGCLSVMVPLGSSPGEFRPFREGRQTPIGGLRKATQIKMWKRQTTGKERLLRIIG